MKSVAVFHRGSLVTNALVQNSVWGRLCGLMFKSKLRKEKSVILEFHREGWYSVHMMFVFQPIDVVWVNKKKRVVQVARNVQPFTPYVDAKKKAQYILELPVNVKRKVKLGDALKFVPIRHLDERVFER